MELQNKSVLITGASRGLGRALSLALADAGARIVLVARDRVDLESTVQEIQRRGGEAYAIAADIGRKEDTYAIAGQAAALAGPIDLLIQNASTLGPTPLRLLLDTDCEDLEATLGVNLVGPFRLAKAVAGSMVLRERGLIVAITSDAAIEAYPGWGAYGISKAALDHLTRTFAVELHDTGVQFLTMDPGEMDTQMHADAVPDADRAILARPEAVAAQIVELIRHSHEFQNGQRLVVSSMEVLK